MSRIWRQVDVNMRLICIDNPNQQAELCVAKTARSQTEIKKKKKKKKKWTGQVQEDIQETVLRIPT